ncbi:MAG: acylphosphatase [Candidatus Magasanikbacteria bacterium]|nr:acylphosphatase [Candidatus Magasanikbacteria bacterium]
MNKHLIIKVHGHVQGVFFRHSARQKALELGLKGFVKNENDGAVSIETEGSPEKLHELVQWCYAGSGYSRTDKVEISEAPLQNFIGFEII